MYILAFLFLGGGAVACPRTSEIKAIAAKKMPLKNFMVGDEVGSGDDFWAQQNVLWEKRMNINNQA